MDLTIYRTREDDLIKGCRKGDHHAQQQLFDLYSSRMLGICYRYVKNTMEAEDILVMAFTKVFDRISQFKGEGSFEGWIRRIAVNEALTWLRRNRAMMVAETDLERADREPDYRGLSDHLEAEDLLNMIGEITPWLPHCLQPVRHRRLFTQGDRRAAWHQREHVQITTQPRAGTPPEASRRYRLARQHKNAAPMNKQPDKIFRDKLLHYERPVSADAWKRVSENIAPRHRTALWLKIAAGLLLLTAAGIFLFSLQGKRPAPFVAQQVEPNKADKPASQQIAPEKNSLPEEVQEQATISDGPGKAEIKTDANRVAQTPAVRHRENPDAVTTLRIEPKKTPTLAVTAGNALPETNGTKETSTQEVNLAASPARTRVTIVMNADEVNEKYLTKKNVVAEATPEEKESSGLQRLLDKAYDLKHNQDPLGDLRQKKNEILALNFRNNKQRHEN